jgi:hypothetical protein
VDSRVGIMIDTKQQHSAIEVVQSSDRAVRPVWKVGRMRRRDLGRTRTAGRERVRRITPKHARHAPERIRHNAEVAARCSHRIKDPVISPVAHRGHHEGARLADRIEQSVDECTWPATHRSDGPEGRVHPDYVARLDAQYLQLTCQRVTIRPLLPLNLVQQRGHDSTG